MIFARGSGVDGKSHALGKVEKCLLSVLTALAANTDVLKDRLRRAICTESEDASVRAS